MAGAPANWVFLPLLSRLAENHGRRPAANTVALSALAVVPFRLAAAARPSGGRGDRRVRRLGLHAQARPGAGRGPARGHGAVPGGPHRTVPAARRHLRDLRRVEERPGQNPLLTRCPQPRHADHSGRVFDVVGTIASGWFTGRLEARRLLAASCALRGIGPLSLPMLLAPSVHPPMLFFIVFYGPDRVATVPPAIALCREHYGDDSAIVFGWVLAPQVGAAVFAFAGGVARDAFGSYDVIRYASGAPCAAAALMALGVRRKPLPRRSRPESRR